MSLFYCSLKYLYDSLFIKNLFPTKSIFHWSRISSPHVGTSPLMCEPRASSITVGGGRIFPRNLRASHFNDDLSEEPNFGRINLAGQYC
jgi:hypothetical protein